MGSESCQIRVLIVDDHPVMRDGLRTAILQEEDMLPVGEACDGAQAVSLYRSLQPDVVLMDLQMPLVDGVEAIRQIRGDWGDARIVVLTTFPGDVRVQRALDAGATAYLLKSADCDEVLAAIRAAFEGRRVLARQAVQDLREHAGYEQLTLRELAVLRLVARGHANQRIADELHISIDTVKARMKSILGKLGADDRTHAVSLALARGMLD